MRIRSAIGSDISISICSKIGSSRDVMALDSLLIYIFHFVPDVRMRKHIKKILIVLMDIPFSVGFLQFVSALILLQKLQL